MHPYQVPAYGSACAHQQWRDTGLAAPFERAVDFCWKQEEDPVHLQDDASTSHFSNRIEVRHDA